jgi:hypothetical protein
VIFWASLTAFPPGKKKDSRLSSAPGRYGNRARSCWISVLVSRPVLIGSRRGTGRRQHVCDVPAGGRVRWRPQFIHRALPDAAQFMPFSSRQIARRKLIIDVAHKGPACGRYPHSSLRADPGAAQLELEANTRPSERWASSECRWLRSASWTRCSRGRQRQRAGASKGRLRAASSTHNQHTPPASRQ